MELVDILNSEKSRTEHSIIVHFIYYKEGLGPLYELEEKLIKVIDESGEGRYDGHEIAMDDSDGFLFMYGTNAEELFKVVKPILAATDFTKSAVACLRFGESGASEVEIEIE